MPISNGIRRIHKGMNTPDAVAQYIDNTQPAVLLALGLQDRLKISLSGLTTTIIQSVKDLLDVVAPEVEDRRKIVLDAVADVFDKVAVLLPLQWRPFAPALKWLLVTMLAPRIYDFVEANFPVAPDVPVVPVVPSPTVPTVIHVDPNTGLPQDRLEALAKSTSDLHQRIADYTAKESQ